QNPLLWLLPESVRGQAGQVAEAVQTGVRIYNAVSAQVDEVQTLITQAQELKANPLAVFGLVGDALSIGGAAAGGIIAVILANIIAIFLMRAVGRNL
ncbi:MAG TPA: hypothetical protein PLK27_09915, partial [Neisseria sp.]|nr:hypothetical protein [Neisseria sp.]